MDHPASPPDPAVIAEFLDACAAAQERERELNLTTFIARFPQHEQSLRAAYESHASASDTDPAMSEKTVGPYRILRELGQGGMGRVYLAEQSQPFERQVALKVIKLGMDTEEILRRFDRERQALALMDHDAIARVFDAGSTASGQPYVALEYVKGEPLTHFCDRNRLTVRDRILLLCRICDGVQHAHQKGIVHRDLTPGNILVAESTHGPIPKIIDFGIARIVTAGRAEVTNTMHGLVLGTPSYMSPEQAGYLDLDVDSRSDVYTLGVLLFELLTGAVPYPGRSAMDLDEIEARARSGIAAKPSSNITERGAAAADAARARRTDPRNLARTLRGDLDAIAGMALATDRQQRYATAEALAADLRNYLALRPIKAKHASFFDSARKSLRRHRQLLSTACLVVAGIAAWVTAYLSSNELRLSRAAATAMVWPSLAQAPTNDWAIEEIERLPQEHRAGAHYIMALAAKRDKQVHRIEQHLTRAMEVVTKPFSDDPDAAARCTNLAIAALYAGEWQIGLELASRLPSEMTANDDFGGVRWYALILAGRYEDAEKQCAPGDFIAKMLDAGSWALRTTGAADARRVYERVLEDAVARSDMATATTAHQRLGGVAWFVGDFETAIAHMRRACQTAAPGMAAARAQSTLGVVLRDSGNYSAAAEALDKALSIAHSNDAAEQIGILNNIGRMALRQDDIARAEDCFRQAIRVSDRFFQPSLREKDAYHGASYAESLLGLGAIASRRGQHDQALLLIQTARMIWQRAAGPESDQVGETESLLGDALGKSDRTDLEYAERLLLRGYAKIAALRTPKARISRMAQARLVAFAERNGFTEKAAAWAKLHLE